MAQDTRFDNFDLTVHLGPGATPWISASSRIGLLHGIPRTGPGILPLNDLLDLVHDYRDSVQFAENAGAAELSDALRELIFGEPQVLELFQATRGAAADRGRQTLIRVLASPHLATLPWELLPDPAVGGMRNRSGYLALAPDSHVVRMARGRSYAMRAAPLKPPLNLLIVLSSPSPKRAGDELLAFDIYEVKRSLLNELQPLIDKGLLTVHVEDRPTLENLRRCIGRVSRGFQLFHYVGHALPDQLVLEDVAGRREDHDSARFCEILRMCPDLRLAVFAGCETARAQTEAADLDTRLAVGWRDLVSLADRCVQEACPMVIGMQAVLPFRTERLFTRFFYQGLASGYSVVESLQLARGATRSDGRAGADLLDWSVPALFIGSGEPGPVIDSDAVGVPPPAFNRRDLKLGLRQSSTRFFARDLALRQAVDLLGGRSRQRVLVVTGTAGVGKTYLVDRALEELGTDASHVLYARANRLAPELESCLAALRNGDKEWELTLDGLKPEQPHRALCKAIADVLRQGTGALKPEKEPPLVDWWDQIIEDINRVRLVVVIDEFELFDEVMEACFTRWLAPLLHAAVRGNGAANMQQRIAVLEGVLDRVRDPHGMPRPGNGKDVFFELLTKLTNGPWQLTPWLKNAACRALEPLVLARLESEGSTQPPGLEPTAAYDPAMVRGVAERIDETRNKLELALAEIAQRRSGARTAVVTTATRADFLGLRPTDRFEMRLAHLTWQETWRWIRRNLPGLTRYGEAELQKAWLRLGPELERWEDLEREVLSRGRLDATLENVLDLVSPPPRRAGNTRPGGPLLRRLGARPLRLAIAGPFLTSPAALAQAITRLANEHGVGGRVSIDGRAAPATLGEIFNIPSPFEQGIATEETLNAWLKTVLAQRPDIVLLDYGAAHDAVTYKLRSTRERELLGRWQHRTLFVAAGGNSGPGYLEEPAVFPEVFAVGSLDDDGAIRPYSTWHAELKKPDVFMPDALDNTPLNEALDRKKIDRVEGTSFAALHAAAAAALVWTLLPELRPAELRRLLLDAAKPIEGEIADGGTPPRSLQIGDALRAARTRLVHATVRNGSCSRETLAAITGQDGLYLQEILDAMTKDGIITRIVGGRLELYELAAG